MLLLKVNQRYILTEMSSKYYYETTSTAPSIGGRWKVGTVIAFLVAVAALIIGVMSYVSNKPKHR